MSDPVHTLADVQIGAGSGRDHVGREVPMLLLGLTVDRRGAEGGQVTLPDVWMSVETAMQLAELLRDHAQRLAPERAAVAEAAPAGRVS